MARHKSKSKIETVSVVIPVKGMTCTSCEKIIEEEISTYKGIAYIKADFHNSEVEVKYDSKTIQENEIRKAIDSLGYECSCKPEKFEVIGEYGKNKQDWIGLASIVIGILAILIATYFLLDANGIISNIKEFLAVAESVFSMSGQDIGAGTILLLFLAGFLTSFHCIAMCGGFVISYTAKAVENDKKPYLSHLKYGAGKTISYTIIGAIFGLLGSVIAFTPALRGTVAILAGLFLIMFGLNMLGLFIFFRKFHLKLPKFLQNKIPDKKTESKGPFIIGLLNGLMIACGPLQAMYILAAGTGSILRGAEILFFFGLGTLPLLLGFGTLTTFLSSKLTHKILKFSGVIVIILGLFMLNSGIVLTGNSVIKNGISGDNEVKSGAYQNNANNQMIPKGYSVAELKDNYQIIKMNVTASGWKPDRFVLYKDIPVKWVIDGQEITSCNNAIQVPSYGLEFKIRKGEQTIEFTPTKTGSIQWSCWMGMIPGQFIVIDKNIEPSQKNLTINSIASASGFNPEKKSGCGCAGMKKNV